MTPSLPTTASNLSTLYEQDYYLWLETTANLLREGQLSALDVANLLEEIEDMGRSERRSLKSNLIVVLLHLLKWQFQPKYRSGSWEGSIVEHRRRIREALDDSPSLQPYLETIFVECYLQAVKQAKAETRLPLKTFPQQCPYELAEVLNDEFLLE
jgi:hypothetical protein